MSGSSTPASCRFVPEKVGPEVCRAPPAASAEAGMGAAGTMVPPFGPEASGIAARAPTGTPET
jgi:hypothetical protein